MSNLKLVAICLLVALPSCYSQQKKENMNQIRRIIEKYSESVIKKDSIVFYDLFDSGNVTWCGALKDRSQMKITANKGSRKQLFFSNPQTFF